MQISRHWRLNAQRYRLSGVRHQDGSVSVYDRPNPVNRANLENLIEELFETRQIHEVSVENVA
mgnify:CR=1 FL=1